MGEEIFALIVASVLAVSVFAISRVVLRRAGSLAQLRRVQLILGGLMLAAIGAILIALLTPVASDVGELIFLVAVFQLFSFGAALLFSLNYANDAETRDLIAQDIV
jgi:hypothetical protein